jgi:hypothetical protein
MRNICKITYISPFFNNNNSEIQMAKARGGMEGNHSPNHLLTSTAKTY